MSTMINEGNSAYMDQLYAHTSDLAADRQIFDQINALGRSTGQQPSEKKGLNDVISEGANYSALGLAFLPAVSRATGPEAKPLTNPASFKMPKGHKGRVAANPTSNLNRVVSENAKLTKTDNVTKAKFSVTKGKPVGEKQTRIAKKVSTKKGFLKNFFDKTRNAGPKRKAAVNWFHKLLKGIEKPVKSFGNWVLKNASKLKTAVKGTQWFGKLMRIPGFKRVASFIATKALPALGFAGPWGAAIAAGLAIVSTALTVGDVVGLFKGKEEQPSSDFIV